jgi:peptidoglycan/xylan/chitin deacetylase (PgdA/CDA1 family)
VYGIATVRLVLRRLLLILLEYLLFVRSMRGQPRLAALTFDDGPQPEQTPAVLAALRACNVSATFFLLASHAEQHPDLVRKLADAKMEIGSHAVHHVSLLGKPIDEQIREITEAARIIAAAAGKRVRLFRPPYGEYDEGTLAALAVSKQELVVWNVDPREWTNIDAIETVSRVVAGARAPAIILMHDASRSTVAAIPRIVRAYRRAGYRFVPVSAIPRL